MIRIHITFDEDQHHALLQIARQEKRSLSDLVREYLNEQLRLHRQRQLAQAADALRQDYLTDSELTAFSVLDGDEIHEEA